MKDRNTIVFAIVVYNEFYWEVESFKSLITSYYNNNTSKVLYIYIFDNTVIQKKINRPTFDNINIKYISFRENRGISKSYNFLAKIALEEGFEWIVFLDQDTNLPIDFYPIYIESAKELDSVKEEISIPIVKSNKKILSPSIYKNYRSKLLEAVPFRIALKNHSAINSGLLIRCKFFWKIGGYNEELFLDFCDHDFFFKIKNHLNDIRIINTELQQDFSAETNSLNQALSRYKIFIKDLKSFQVKRNHFIILFLVDIPHLIKLLFKYKSSKFIYYRFIKK